MTARLRLLPLLLTLCISGSALALPTDLVDKVESGVLCRSDWSTVFWDDYLNRSLQKPIRDWGEARWWNSQGATIGGVATTEIFLNLDKTINTSVAFMIGVLIPEPVEDVRKKIQDATGIKFQPVNTKDGVRYVSAEASVLVGLTDKRSTKWYCAKWNLGNRL